MMRVRLSGEVWGECDECKEREREWGGICVDREKC